MFAGGWTLSVAEVAVCAGDPCGRLGGAGPLTGLVDKSLVVTEAAGDGSRYRLLETIRQYGGDRLGESRGGRDVRCRTATCRGVLALAEEAEPQLRGPEQAAWLSRLEAEHDNLRAGLAWADGTERERTERERTERERPEDGGLRLASDAGLRLAGSLWQFWVVRCHLAEGRRWLGLALARSGASGGKVLGVEATKVRAKALNGAGVLAFGQGDYAGAGALYEESLPLFRQLGSQVGIVGVLGNLGMVSYAQGDYAGARSLFEESLTLYRQVGNQRGIAYALLDLGSVAQNQGDYGGARSLFEESLTLSRQVGDPQGITYALLYLGHVARNQGDHAGARALYEESLTLSRQSGDQVCIASALEGLAVLASSQAQPERGVRLWGAAAALREQIGAPLSPDDRRKQEAEIVRTRQVFGETAFSAAWDAGRAMTLDEAVAYALAVE